MRLIKITDGAKRVLTPIDMQVKVIDKGVCWVVRGNRKLETQIIAYAHLSCCLNKVNLKLLRIIINLGQVCNISWRCYIWGVSYCGVINRKTSAVKSDNLSPIRLNLNIEIFGIWNHCQRGENRWSYLSQRGSWNRTTKWCISLGVSWYC